MSDRVVMDAELRAKVDELSAEERLDVLVYPFAPGSGDTDQVIATLERRGLRAGVDYNPLDLAGCVVARASREVIEDLVRCSAVRRIAANPTATADGSL